MANKSLTAQQVMDSIPPVKGEARIVYRCETCGINVGKRCIPYGLGQGATFNPCMCWSVNGFGRGGFKKVLEQEP